MTFKYLKVLKQIDKQMTAKGYKLISVTDGEDRIVSSKHTKTELYDWATQCDIGSMHYQTVYDNSKSVTFYLVYGNELYETIANAGYKNEESGKDCDEVMNIVHSIYETA